MSGRGGGLLAGERRSRWRPPYAAANLLGLRWQYVKLLDGRLLGVGRRASATSSRPRRPGHHGGRSSLGPRHSRPFRSNVLAPCIAPRRHVVFCHPALGTPLDPSKVAVTTCGPRSKRQESRSRFAPGTARPHRPHARSRGGNPTAYVQMRAGHSQGSITERYVHAAQVAFPGAAEPGENRIFSEVAEAGVPSPVATAAPIRPRHTKSPALRGFLTPRVGLEPTTLRLTAGCSAN